MRSAQTDQQRERKSKGERPGNAPRRTGAAQTHAMDRLAHGFNIDQMVSEYRALRATVVRLWSRDTNTDGEAVDELVRFNEAIDQARVAAHSSDDDVFLCVHNEGGPIPRVLQRRMFEPLVRGIRQNESVANDRGGLGLGLYMASEVAQGHDGYVDLESTAADGTTFRARLSRRIATGRRSDDQPGSGSQDEEDQ